MNKNQIKNYAIWARKELIDRVTQKAYEYGISKDNIVNDKVYNNDVIIKRNKLINEINDKGYNQVIEEVAYTWFNRFIALRYMEVNNYLPQRVKPFTNENNEFKPEILDEAIHLELEGLDKEEVFKLVEEDKDEELYKLLLIALCNDMHQYLSGMFETIDDYKVLLFPDNLLREGSVVSKLVTDIDEDSWTDQVQIIGWMYQYYNTEPKSVSQKKKNKTKDDIAAITQLFTPDWIVKYMVENSVGRLWIERHPDDALKSNWKYYVDNAEQSEEVNNQINEILNTYRIENPTEIKAMDCCCGSGHILVYMFDVLMQIYVNSGWTEREATRSIIENNIYGLDLDKRAYQLSYFALMMKARAHDRRFLSRGITPNVYELKESNHINRDLLNYFYENNDTANYIYDKYLDNKEYGSIIDVELTQEQIDGIKEEISNLEESIDTRDMIEQLDIHVLLDEFKPLIRLAEVMSSKYDVTITNPPYMAPEAAQKKYVAKHFPNSKTDFFAIFMEVCANYTKENGYISMINMHSWMFISSFEKLRKWVLDNKTIINMLHLGPRAFDEIGGEVVQTTSFILENNHFNQYKGTYYRLIEPKTEHDKGLMFLNNENKYATLTSNFDKIPGSPIAYWVAEKIIDAFGNGILLQNLAACCTGMQTGANDKFIRVWYEIRDTQFEKRYMMSNKKWVKYNCGGESRKWYGNHLNVIDWENDGYNIKTEKGSVIRNSKYFFKEGITWKRIGSQCLFFRYLPKGFIFDQSGDSMFLEDENQLKYLLGIINSKVCELIFGFIAPTMNLTAGNMNKLPILMSNKYVLDINRLVNDSIINSKQDWDSFETSWDFEEHSLIKNKVHTIEEAYNLWEEECTNRFNTLKSNEEELNRVFIDIYGLQNELDPYVEDKDITVRKADKVREIKSLISYAVGCMFGRYSLDTKGLAYAGGEWDDSKYITYIPDNDNIIPITDDEYFRDDDIVFRFIEFIKVAYGEDYLEDNLQYIADVLGGKGTSREVVRNYFIKDFYKDHCKIYQKRPIYWLFDSGKKNGFKALIYMHRYTPDLIARLRTQYVHEQQSRYTSQIESLQHELSGDITASEKAKLTKELKKYTEQELELRNYEEEVHTYADMMIDIDLDDGVKQNYPKFGKLLAKIK